MADKARTAQDELEERPSPTQAEVDATKLGIAAPEAEPKTKQVAAKPAPAGYETRQSKPIKSDE